MSSSGGINPGDCIGLSIIVLSCIGLLYLNWKWRNWINKK